MLVNIMDIRVKFLVFFVPFNPIDNTVFICEIMVNTVIMSIHCELRHISKLEVTVHLIVLLELMMTFNF